MVGEVVSLDKNWKKRLKHNENTGVISKTIENFCTILENDFKDKLFFNELSGKEEVVVNGRKKSLETIDFDRIYMTIEKKYGIYDVKKCDSAIRFVAEKNRYNPIKEYLEGLQWDGVKRIDTAFSDYLGAEESDYNAMCLRLTLFGAIERLYNPRS